MSGADNASVQLWLKNGRTAEIIHMLVLLKRQRAPVIDRLENVTSSFL